MQNELNFLNLVNKVLDYGNIVTGRNGEIKTLPNQILELNLQEQRIPLITTRFIKAKAVAGEYAAMIRGAKHLDDFKQFDCGYWERWCKDDGSINIDYGYKFYEQAEYIIKALRSSEHNRRLLMSFWNVDNVLKGELDLPCCFHTFQFYKMNGELQLTVLQRSADMMVGIPHDIVWYFILLQIFAAKSGLKPTKITIMMGDCHIYSQHYDNAKVQLSREILDEPMFHLDSSASVTGFIPDDFEVIGYKHQGKLHYDIIT